MYSLYEVNHELEILLELAHTGSSTEAFDFTLCNEDGSIDLDRLNEKIVELYDTRDDLIEDEARYIQNLQAEADMIKKEEERLYERRKKLEQRASFVSEKLTNMLEATNWSSKKSSVKVTFRSSEALIIDDESKIDKSYIITKTIEQVDKVACKKAIKSGVELEGCHIEKRKNLTVK